MRLTTRTSTAAVGIAIALVAAGCGTQGTGGGAAGGSSSATATLTTETAPTGPVTRNFNPFFPTSADNELGATGMIYEPLLQFDLLKPNKVYPWLATSYSWAEGGRQLSFTLRSRVTWSDGKPFTSKDVATTFEILKKYPDTNSNGIDPTSIATPSPQKVVLTFKTPQYVNLYYIGSQDIVPNHVWASVANPATYEDPSPVGTGPYMLKTFSTSSVSLTRRSHYWQSDTKAPETLVYPAYDSNTNILPALEDGQLNWAGNFIPNVQKVFLSKSSDNHAWDPAVNTQVLLPNDGEFPFNDPAVRRAVAYAINRPLISSQQDYGYLRPATTTTDLTLPSFSKYLDPSLASSSYSYDPAKARSILTAAGYTKGPGGFLTKGGKELSIKLIGDSAFTNVIGAYPAIQSELQSIGIKVTIEALSADAWTADLRDGDFQLTWDGGINGQDPYIPYNDTFNSSLTAGEGKEAVGDFERYKSPAMDRLLTQDAATNSPAAEQKALDGIEKLLTSDVPVIPFLYGVAWSEYSSKQFAGWPSPSNPYMTNSPGGSSSEYVLLHLKPAT